MVILDVSVVNVALPSIRKDLGFSAVDLQWVVNAYTLTFAGFLLLGGRAADLLGRRRVFVAGLLLFAARLAGRRPVDQPGHADRRARGPGARRRRRRAGHAGDHHHHVRRGLRAQPRARLLGRDGRRRRIDRASCSAACSPSCWAGSGSSSSTCRSGSSARSPRCASSRRARARSRASATSTSPARCSVTAGLVLLTFAIVRTDVNGWTSAATLEVAAAGLALLVALPLHRAPRAAPARAAGDLPLAHAHRGQPRGLPARLLGVRDVVLRLAVPAAGPRLHADRDRVELPADDRRDHRRLDLRRAACRRGSGPGRSSRSA